MPSFPTFSRIIGGSLLASLLAFAGAPAALAQAPATETAPAQPADPIKNTDAWYIVELMGNRAGYMNSKRTQSGDTITSQTKMVFELGRGEQKVRISMESEFVETPDGKPLRMKSRQMQGQAPLEQEYVFRDNDIEVTTRQAGQVSTATMPKITGDWLTPAAAERESERRFKAGETKITIRTIDPMIGVSPVEMTRSGFTPAKLTIDGKEVDALETAVEQSFAPGVTSKEWLDSEGDLLRGETLMGGAMKIVMTRSTREKASKSGGGATPEIMVSTFIKPDKPIAHARRSTQAQFTLSVTEGDLPDFPDTGTQDFTRTGPAAATLLVRTQAFLDASPEDIANDAYLASSALAKLDDQRLAAFVGRVDATLSPAEKAEALRREVYRFIADKNLGTGMGSSTEVLRTKQGDCTEHGVLLCAALRKAGIPARVATGLIYADAFAGGKDIFGYHMWAQALLEVDGKPRWIDLDGTLPDATPYDATHIAIATSDLSDEKGTLSLLNVAQVMGRLQITVDNVEHAGPAK
ncbi:MAG TPA: transglutaminase-like domain-containing protein [Phycisphaerales bacterium]|nr:transglutaminase-like domain-containing protein [Phycisphaerales bacterium]